jgi:hypothetical protein
LRKLELEASLAFFLTSQSKARIRLVAVIGCPFASSGGSRMARSPVFSPLRTIEQSFALFFFSPAYLLQLGLSFSFLLLLSLLLTFLFLYSMKQHLGLPFTFFAILFFLLASTGFFFPPSLCLDGISSSSGFLCLGLA